MQVRKRYNYKSFILQTSALETHVDHLRDHKPSLQMPAILRSLEFCGDAENYDT